MEISKDLLVSHFGCCLILGVSTCTVKDRERAGMSTAVQFGEGTYSIGGIGVTLQMETLRE